MARPIRIEYSGALYHITSRGNARQDIFIDDNDYLEFMDVLCLVVKRYNWLLHAYCLMGNHYHLLIETPDGNLSAGMRQLNGIYTQRFNRQNQRVGHLMQGRFKAILVDKDSYLGELSRYIVLNPVRAGMKNRPEQWKWSSYNKTVGFAAGSDCLTTEWLLRLFGKNRKTAQEKYKEFVRAGIGKDGPWDRLVGQVLLGSEEFIEKMRIHLEEKEDIEEIPRTQRVSARPKLEQILANKKEKAEAAYDAHVKYGYRLKEIGKVLGVHYATVSRLVRAIEGRN